MKDVKAETKTNRKTNQIIIKKKPIKKKKKKTISEISVCPNKLSYNIE